MKKITVLIGAVMFLSFAMATSALALEGDCSACHTMHNSYEGEAVAMVGNALGGGATVSITPLANLLKADCIGCHATYPTGGSNKILDAGLNEVPQVMHSDPTGDLAGGNFQYIVSGGAGNHSGHNVSELFAGDDNYAFGYAPGQYRGDSSHALVYDPTGSNAFATFSCAGAGGCHGTRSQLLSGATNDNTLIGDTSDDYFENAVKRTGMAAIAGSHHKITDGVKNPTNPTGPLMHDAQAVADGYRLIPFLAGNGNNVAGDRWENVDATSHNEYFGVAGGFSTTSCGICHVEGNDSTNGGISSRMTWDSILKVPNNSQSGFCSSCHGNFHSAGGGNTLAANGVSGAFLRHPSDYTLPAGGEFDNMSTYNVNTKVARADITAPQNSGRLTGDLVMCLSCHGSHATKNRSMLTFDYDLQVAGGGAQGDGCLACHTSKE